MRGESSEAERRAEVEQLVTGYIDQGMLDDDTSERVRRLLDERKFRRALDEAVRYHRSNRYD